MSSPPPRDLPNPGIKPRSPALQADFLPSEPPGKPKSIPAAAAKSLQLYLTLCDPRDGSPPGSPNKENMKGSFRNDVIVLDWPVCLTRDKEVAKTTQSSDISLTSRPVTAPTPCPRDPHHLSLSKAREAQWACLVSPARWYHPEYASPLIAFSQSLPV